MAQPPRTLALRILSPAVELGHGMDMADVPVDTTIATLKAKLAELLPSHPTPESMRLIHLGRLLANDSESLAHIFGDAALSQTAPFTLHLVVRPPPTPTETAANRQSPFASWPATNILPPGASQHPFLPPGATFVPQPQAATALPPHPAAPPVPTPNIQHATSPSANLLQQLMERQQEQVRQLHNPRPHSNPPPNFPHGLMPGMPRPPLPQSAPHTPPPFPNPHVPQTRHHPLLHPHAHPGSHNHTPQPSHHHTHAHTPQPPQGQPQHRHATITINQSTVAIPMHLPNGMPLPGFPPMHNLFHQAAQPQMQRFNPTSSTVYLLSSPTGPQALLFSPQGTYAGSLPQASMPGLSNIANPLFAQTRPQTPAAQVPPPVAIDHQQVPEQLAQQIVQQMNHGGQQNQEFNLLAPWQPLLAQGWMLLRLLFFAWILLGTGQGWRRPLTLLAIGVVFWAINAGGIGNTVRDAIRSWWEAVVALPGQAQQQEHGAVRQALRPAERLLALLIASLWPGVGERTVVARREAEERQRREEGERQAAEAERQRQLEAEQSTPPQDQANAEESNPVTTIADQATVTASGNDVTSERQEVRERKPADQGSNVESTSTPGPSLTRDEQRAQQLNNLTADW